MGFIGEIHGLLTGGRNSTHSVHLKKHLKKSILRADIFALLFINEPLATLKKVTDGCHFALHLQMNV